MHIKPLSLLMVIIIGGGLVWLGRVQDPADLVGKPAPRSNAPAPNFTLVDLDGNTHSLSDFHGRPVIINFWATWCPPCRAEMPDLQRVYENYQDDDLVILAINNDEPPDVIIDFVEEYDLTFLILLDEGLDVTRLYEVQAYPSTFFLDRAGRIRYDTYSGPLTESYVESIVLELLG